MTRRFLMSVVGLLMLGGCDDKPAPAVTVVATEQNQTDRSQVKGTATNWTATETCPAFVQCHPTWKRCTCLLGQSGEHLMTEADFDGNGTIDYRMTYNYDDKGNILNWENDRGADGAIEVRCTFDPVCPPPHPNKTCRCTGGPG